jgi:hypothetical protein
LDDPGLDLWEGQEDFLFYKTPWSAQTSMRKWQGREADH